MWPLNNLLNWSLDERVLNKLKGTGFDTLRGFTQHLCLNLPLINVLISRYHADTRSFILGSAENPFNIAFGLEDVLYLTGLPIDGKAVTGVDPKDKMGACLRYLGKQERYRTGVTSYISLSWLRENFMTLKVDDENLSEEELAYHVRAYVLYAIGCTIAPRKNQSVSPIFLPLLENVDNIGSYAWGAALLANIHDSLENPTKYTVGFYFPLMIFTYIRFPGLSSMFKLDCAVINVFPLVVSWLHALDLVLQQPIKNHDEVNFEIFFERLKEDGTGENKVEWQPYAELSSNFLPQHLREQLVLSKSRTILICFERAVYHRPDKCQRQLGLAGHAPKGVLIEIKTISRVGKKGKIGNDWSKKGKYLDYVSEWDKRFDLLIDRDDDAYLEKTVIVLDNQDPEKDKYTCPFEEEACRAEASLIAELRKETEKLKEEIELYRKYFPEHVNRILRIEESLVDLMENNGLNSSVDNVDVDHQSAAGDTTSSRVRNSTEIGSCDPQIEAVNAKKQRVSPSTTTTAGVVVDRTEPPLIIDVDSDSDESNIDSFVDDICRKK